MVSAPMGRLLQGGGRTRSEPVTALISNEDALATVGLDQRSRYPIFTRIRSVPASSRPGQPASHLLRHCPMRFYYVSYVLVGTFYYKHLRPPSEAEKLSERE